MKRYKLNLSYDGTQYHGWQVQKNAKTIQQTVQDALGRVFGIRPDITGCSRTDSGVHAEMFCAHLDLQTIMEPLKIAKAVNANLPHDIAVTGCEEVDRNFHARYSAKGKRYIYKIYNGMYRNPFYRNYALHITHPLDDRLMNLAAGNFLGEHDFRSFCAAGSGVQDTVRTVSLSQVKREQDMVYFIVRADGFLYNMVRIMVGSLLQVARGKMTPDAIQDVILKKNRTFAGPTVPAHGLYLHRIYY